MQLKLPASTACHLGAPNRVASKALHKIMLQHYKYLFALHHACTAWGPCSSETDWLFVTRLSNIWIGQLQPLGSTIADTTLFFWLPLQLGSQAKSQTRVYLLSCQT
jgi:hypothetical protein